MVELVELGKKECLDLLGREEVGRVGLETPLGLRIMPVNYTVHGDDIVFRTTPYSELGTYGRGADLAFEVDALEGGEHSGYSVLAIGPAEAVDDPAEVHRLEVEADPQPWAGGRRSLYMRLHIRELTGRRIPAAVGSGAPRPEE